MLTSCFPSLPHLAHPPPSTQRLFVYFNQAFWPSEYINLAVGRYCLLSTLHSVLRSRLSFFLRLLLLCLPGLCRIDTNARTHARTPAMPDPAQINRSLGTIKTELEYLANSGVLSPPQLQSIQAQLPVRCSRVVITR